MNSERLWIPNRSLHLPSPTKKEFDSVVKSDFLVDGFVELGVWNKDKEFIYQKREVMQSSTQQFLEILLAQMKQDYVLTVVDTGGTERSLFEYSTNFDISALKNDDTHGIVVGTGDTAVDIADSKLVTQIAEGTGVGQFTHQVQGLAATVTISDPNCYIEPYRNFNNNSGASVTVKETGIYCKGYSAGARFFCIYRDVPTEVVVPNGGGIYVKYLLNISE